jgi:hypothetical protein
MALAGITHTPRRLTPRSSPVRSHLWTVTGLRPTSVANSSTV